MAVREAALRPEVAVDRAFNRRWMEKNGFANNERADALLKRADALLMRADALQKL